MLDFGLNNSKIIINSTKTKSFCRYNAGGRTITKQFHFKELKKYFKMMSTVAFIFVCVLCGMIYQFQAFKLQGEGTYFVIIPLID